MNPKFQGFGRALILVPVLSYIPLRALLGDIEESHHFFVLSISLAVSAFITLTIAWVLDRRAGIDLFSQRAWTVGLMESRHIFYYLPIRLVGAALLLASIAVTFIP